MGRGRVRFAFAAAFVAALTAIGCGSESHPNEPRPQPPTRVSVTLSDKGVLVQPHRIAFGPEPKQQIPQNQNHPQPKTDAKGPLDVIFVISNQTDHQSYLQVHGRPKDVASPKFGPQSPATYQAELPTGSYYVTAEGVPPASTYLLFVGPDRTSSENDVLLP